MKSLRKTLREHRLKTHEQIRAWLQPKLGRLGTRYRLAARIRLANYWARKHPKRTFATVVSSLLLLLLGTVALDSLQMENNQGSYSEPNISMIANMEPMFEGFRTIQANKDVHRHTLQDMALKGQVLRHQLDSMIAIPHKSHTDSIRIIQSYRQLENIVHSLKNNDNP